MRIFYTLGVKLRNKRELSKGEDEKGKFFLTG
jgi:hypothetical protein